LPSDFASVANVPEEASEGWLLEND
jgi:hypothetical protein